MACNPCFIVFSHVCMNNDHIKFNNNIIILYIQTLRIKCIEFRPSDCTKLCTRVLSLLFICTITIHTRISILGSCVWGAVCNIKI